jgi:hypothetical protein
MAVFMLSTFDGSADHRTANVVGHTVTFGSIADDILYPFRDKHVAQFFDHSRE